MPNYRADLEYDGTGFCGWQVQPGQRTVQGELCRALSRLFAAEVRVVGAGRTDAGVPALGQVASFATARERRPEAVQRGLNALLPRDVRVHRVRIVPDDFSARHTACARTYRYQMLRDPSALWRRFYYELPAPVDIAAMSAAAAAFHGEHDFTAFVRSDAGDACRCCVESTDVREERGAVLFEITANRFFHNMVRRIAGVLVEVGRGRVDPDSVREIVRDRDRSRGGPCLPPQGLFLVAVRYPENAAAPAPRFVDAVEAQSVASTGVPPSTSGDG